MRQFPKISAAWPVLRRFLADLRPQRRRVVTSLVLSLAAAGIELLRPRPLQWIVDHALLPQAANLEHPAFFYVWTGALAYALISLARAACDYLAALGIAESTRQLTRSLRARLFSHLLALPPRFHAQHRTGDLVVRLQGDVGTLSSTLVDSLVGLSARVVLIVGTVVMMLLIDPLLALGTLACAPLALVVVGWISRRIHSAVRKARRKEGDFADSSFEYISSIALIQSLGRAEFVVRDFLRSSRSSARADCQASRLEARLGASVDSLAGLALATALLWGSQRVLAGQLSAGELLAFAAYVRSAAKPMRQSSRTSARIAKGVACGERILAVLDTPSVQSSVDGTLRALEQPVELGFHSVCFAHGEGDSRENALDNFSASFRRGQPALVFGPSGAGKSTLLTLALRLEDPDSGMLTLDGLDLRDLDRNSLRERFAVCPQETGLFGTSVRENLLLGRPEADEDALWEALREAAADEFVRRLPQGLDTPLGQLGSGLSGGERRRLALARTFLRKAPILVLDEPFNWLDALSVARVRTTILERSRAAIVIVIAHDRDEGRHFSKVLLLAAGRVSDHGSHEELLRRAPAYREAVSLEVGPC